MLHFIINQFVCCTDHPPYPLCYISGLTHMLIPCLDIPGNKFSDFDNQSFALINDYFDVDNINDDSYALNMVRLLDCSTKAASRLKRCLRAAATILSSWQRPASSKLLLNVPDVIGHAVALADLS